MHPSPGITLFIVGCTGSFGYEITKYALGSRVLAIRPGLQQLKRYLTQKLPVASSTPTTQYFEK